MRRLLLAVLLLSLLAPLAGCGFSPVYGTNGLDNTSVAQQLASVAIPEQTTRVGQLIRNEILSAIAPAGTHVETEYRLDMIPQSSNDALVEAQNTDILRRSYRLNVTFELVKSASGEPVYSGKTFSYVSYDRTGAPFANQQAHVNAEERAAREVGLDIRTRLAAYFTRH